MDKAAFALKEGEWTQLSDNPDEFVFIELVNRSRKPLDEVSSQIEKQLQAEHLREELNALKSKTGVWMDEEYFASKNPATTSTTPEASGQESSRGERRKMRTTILKSCYMALPTLILGACIAGPTVAQAQMTSVGIDCSQVASLLSAAAGKHACRSRPEADH